MCNNSKKSCNYNSVSLAYLHFHIREMRHDTDAVKIMRQKKYIKTFEYFGSLGYHPADSIMKKIEVTVVTKLSFEIMWG